MARNIPVVLWIALVALVAFSGLQALIALGRGSVPIFLGAALGIVLALGLYRGHKWAFVVTLAFATVGALFALARNPIGGLLIALLNAVVAVPVWMARDYFFASRGVALPPNARYCPRCGRDTAGPPTTNCPVCKTT